MRRLLTSSGLTSRWALVSLATLIYWVGPQAVRLFYPLRMHDLGASDLVIGLVVGASAVAGLLLAVPSGYFLDRLESRTVLTWSTLGLSVTTGAFVFADSIASMAVLMLTQGLFQMWVWLVLQEIMTHVGRSAIPRSQLSLFSLAWGVGLAAGPSIGAYAYDQLGFSSLNIGCCLLTLMGVMAALALPRTGHRATDASGKGERDVGLTAALRRTSSNPVVVGVMIAGFVNIFVGSLRSSFYSLFLQRHGVALSTIGICLSAVGVASLAVRIVLPMVTRRLGLIQPLVWSTVVAIAGVGLTPFAVNTPLLILGAVMIGAGLGANPPITVQLLAGAVDDRGVAVGMRMVANRLAQVVQPVSMGLLAATLGLGASFPLAAALLLLPTAWMARRLGSQKLETGR
jgi:MFS family permease